MSNIEPRNCWEYWRCLEHGGEQCQIYKNKLEDCCWAIGSVNCFKYLPVLKDVIRNCLECPWYKKLNI